MIRGWGGAVGNKTRTAGCYRPGVEDNVDRHNQCCLVDSRIKLSGLLSWSGRSSSAGRALPDTYSDEQFELFADGTAEVVADSAARPSSSPSSSERRLRMTGSGRSRPFHGRRRIR